MVPNLAMPEAVQMLESLEFPGCIRDDIALGAKEVRETVALELIAIQSQHPVHLVALDKWCVEFAFAEEMIPEAARKAITQRVFKLNASMFPASAWRNSIRKRWLENGVFEFGPV